MQAQTTSTIKAIETVYPWPDGPRYRSRLEARWAVFFDTLEIRHEYEPEGYELGGVRYLPDFYLPVEEYFIEIKGQKASGGESDKALRLARKSGKSVFVFDTGIGAHDAHPSSGWFAPGSVIVFPGFGDDSRFVYPFRDMSDGLVARLIEMRKRWLTSHTTYVERGLRVKYCVKHLLNGLPPEYSDELRNILGPVDLSDFYAFIHVSSVVDRYAWHQCMSCGYVTILRAPWSGTDACMHCRTIGQISPLSPQLVAAYAAARQARFEHGEHGR